MPNSDHGLDDTDAPESFGAWYAAILNNVPRPKFTWNKRVTSHRGRMIVKPETKPTEVKLWQATNPDARDFRLETFGPKWTSSALQPNSKGVFAVQVPAPEKGWTAFFVELVFDSGQQDIPPFKFTTDVAVVPDTLPFAEEVAKMKASQAG